MSILALVERPAKTPVSLEDAKHHCRVEHGDDDQLLEAIIEAATDRVQVASGRQLITATYDYYLDRWPSCGFIEVPSPPLRSVSAITYVDTAGVTQTWASSNYLATPPAGSQPTPTQPAGRITLAYGAIWPTVLDQANAIKVRFVAGYGDEADKVPAAIRHALKLLIGTWYENREDDIVDRTITNVPTLPNGAQRLLVPFRWRREAA